jgi:hypothetical protein
MLMKLSTWSCPEKRILEEVKMPSLIIVPLKGRNSLNIWEQLQQIRILVRKKLRVNVSQGMLVIIRCRILVIQFAI